MIRERGLQAAVRVRNLDGGIAYERRLKSVEIAGNSTRQLTRLPSLGNL